MSDQEIIGPDDRFDDPFADEPFDEPRTGMSGRAKVFAGGAILIGVVALGVVGWLAFQQGVRTGAEGAAPIIQAEPDPIKRKPENPGGLDVPHQDKLVFNRLAPGQVQEPVERLLPPPEEPTERPQVSDTPPEVTPDAPAQAQMTPPEAAAPETADAPTPPASAPLETVEVAPSPPAPPVPAPPAESQQAAAPATPQETAPVPEPEPEPTAQSAPAPKAATPAAIDGGWKVQMAAVSSRAAADAEWKRLQSRHPDLLGSLNLNVQTVTLSRGTFHRIQAGPLADRSAASALCTQLKSQKQDCLVVAP